MFDTHLQTVSQSFSQSRAKKDKEVVKEFLPNAQVDALASPLQHVPQSISFLSKHVVERDVGVLPLDISTGLCSRQPLAPIIPFDR